MSIAYTDTQHYSDIADAIRTKNGSADTYTPSEMATAITDLPSGGGGVMQMTFTMGANTITNGGALYDYLLNKIGATEDNLYYLYAYTSPKSTYEYNEIVSATVGKSPIYFDNIRYNISGNMLRHRNGSITLTQFRYGGFDAKVIEGDEWTVEYIIAGN